MYKLWKSMTFAARFERYVCFHSTSTGFISKDGRILVRNESYFTLYGSANKQNVFVEQKIHLRSMNRHCILLLLPVLSTNGPQFGKDQRELNGSRLIGYFVATICSQELSWIYLKPKFPTKTQYLLWSPYYNGGVLKKTLLLGGYSLKRFKN